MKRLNSIIIIGFFATVLPQTQPVLAADNLPQQLNQLLNEEPDLQGAIAGVSIRNAANGEIVYDHMGEIRLRPASNMKLLTAAAALSVLGQDYTFKTELLTDGEVKKKTLLGDLYLKGKGDPTLLKEDFDKMAVELKTMGIHKITGNLVGDDTWYDDIRYSVDLPWSDEQTYYGAQISALTASPTEDYDSGSVLIEVKPSNHEGEKADITITPNTDFVKIINQTETGTKDGKKELTFEREHAKNTIRISGTLPVTSTGQKEWIGVWEPTRYALTLFNQSLTEQGIQLMGKIKTGTTPADSKIVHTHSSIKLSELLVPFMKLSNNGHAETLVKEMGKVVTGEGSWEKGLKVMEAELTKFGINTETLVLRDGSGISHVNLVPAAQLSHLLVAVQQQIWFPAFLHSLPVAGESEKKVGGTLRSRMKSQNVKGKVFAKTGTISTVSTLSGYVQTKSGQTLIFSIMLNNLIDDSKGKKIEDKLISIIASH
ncbi:D-alanyl-D-alanine carboxypeptidase/D-alanyl-D-alanine-endopeptidase [Bacillus sp. OK048]|uniref:D-alanyl-D-alanine carboxypeptidase/D-alanyl-D-alanine endopeptidase n=1 Tax=Bacillus sp. OK048 TaxID=1882761 RepID=UPI00088ED541|nr:D-alanyl-D-alanine carboxypeptidase/D-alanyl-D-alanine-endopeptidase [Bacillus sp. OK048]SDN45484.1 D-alanyl-D-alanine carboxypeptidase / D-alanyl-D-alanine-endopeptidase (penicillin-binding protein 4) [Bacillus sp. OK048]